MTQDVLNQTKTELEAQIIKAAMHYWKVGGNSGSTVDIRMACLEYSLFQELEAKLKALPKE